MGMLAYCSDHDSVKCALAGSSKALFSSATGLACWQASFPTHSGETKLHSQICTADLTYKYAFRFSLSKLTSGDKNINFTLIFGTQFLLLLNTGT